MLILAICCVIGWILGCIFAGKMADSTGGDIASGIALFMGIVIMIINTLLWLLVFFGVGFFIK